MPRRGPSQEAIFQRLVFDKLWAIVWAILIRSRVGVADRQDLGQEIIIRIWQTRGSYRRQKGSPRQWVCTIAKRMVIDFLRKGGRVVQEELPETLVDDARNPEESVEWSQLAQLADEAVQGLPADERRVLILHEIEGKSFDQIGKMLGISSSTAHARYERGMEKLRKAKEDGTLSTFVVPLVADASDPPTQEMLDRAWQRFVDAGGLDLPPDSEPPPSGTRRTETPGKLRKLGPLVLVLMGPGLAAPQTEPPATTAMMTVVAPATTSIATEPTATAVVLTTLATAPRSPSLRRPRPADHFALDHGGAVGRHKSEVSTLGETASR